MIAVVFFCASIFCAVSVYLWVRVYMSLTGTDDDEIPLRITSVHEEHNRPEGKR